MYLNVVLHFVLASCNQLVMGKPPFLTPNWTQPVDIPTLCGSPTKPS